MNKANNVHIHYSWIILAIGVLSLFGAIGLGRFGYTTILPNMQAGLKIDNGAAGLLTATGLIGYLAFSTIGGALASRYGGRLIASLGLLCVGLGMVFMGLSDKFISVALWSFLVGIGTGAVHISVFGLVLRNNPTEKGLKPLGEENLTPLAVKAVPDWKSVYFLPPVWILGLVYALFGFAYMTFMTYFVTHLVSDPGFTEAEAVRLFMIMGWISLISGLIWGSVSDFIGRKRTLVILYLIHGFSYGLFGLGHEPVHFVLAAVLYGLSSWSVSAIMAATCGDMLGPELAPAGLGFITLFVGVGQVLGPIVGGSVADAQGSFSSVFMITSAAVLAGAAITIFFVKEPVQQGTIYNISIGE